MYKRIRNIVLLVLSVAYFPLRGNARKTNEAKRFVIIYPTNNIGDMVCVTPLLDAIRTHTPGAHITVVGSKINRDILQHHPSVNAYVVHTSPWEVIGTLRQETYDVGIAINMDAVSLAVLFLGNVRAVSCFVLQGALYTMMARPYRVLSRFAHQITYIPGEYIPRKLIELLKPFGEYIEVGKKSLFYGEEATLRVQKMLERKGIFAEQEIVAIAPGAGSDLKRWPAKRFADVANYIYATHGYSIVFIGGPNDVKAITECLPYLHSDVHYIHPGPLSMEELKATLGRAILLIGNDSGAVHVAEGVGTKAIAIVGATDDAEHLEASEALTIIRGTVHKDGIYQAYIGNELTMDVELAKEQMESVGVDEVINSLFDTKNNFLK